MNRNDDTTAHRPEILCRWESGENLHAIAEALDIGYPQALLLLQTADPRPLRRIPDEPE